MTVSYNLKVKRSAEKELRALPRPDLRRIVERIQRLAENPFAHGHQKLSGLPLYRIRQGNYRILYSVDLKNRVIEIIRIGHRREVYR